jgi:hypothetical protein
MASAITACGEWNPKPRRVISRSWVLTCSTRAFESPWRIAASMPARWSRIVRASLTNGSRRHRHAHFSQAPRTAIASPGSTR